MIVRHQRAGARFFKVLAAEVSPPRAVRVKMDGQELSVTYAPLTLRARTAMFTRTRPVWEQSYRPTSRFDLRQGLGCWTDELLSYC